MRLYCDITVRDANILLIGLILFELCLVLIFAVDTALGSPRLSIQQLFDLDGEGNIPAWFSSVQLFLIGLLFLLKSRQLDPDHSPSPLFLLMVSAGFIFLSADEMASIHEKLSLVFKHVEWIPRFKEDHGLWVFIYAIIGLILLLANLRAVAAMWNRYRHATSIMAIGMGFVMLGGVGIGGNWLSIFAQWFDAAALFCRSGTRGIPRNVRCQYHALWNHLDAIS